MSTGQPESGSLVQRILLGAQLRRLREAMGITREAAGYSIRASESKISRMELGRVGFKERDVADLLTLYGVMDESDRAALIGMARGAGTPGWWHNFSDVLPAWFQTYVGLEESASLIRTYEVQFVPGLLQTSDYAKAVTRLGQRSASETEIERRAGLRMRRQELILSGQGSDYLAVIDEAALRRPAGGPQVMRAQLEWLIEVGQRPNITILVMPFSAGGHAGESGAFTILRFPGEGPPDIVYLEQLTGAMYLDKHDDVQRYETVMRRLVTDAEDAEESRKRLGSLALRF